MVKFIKILILFLINFYQKYLSVISFGSCRYHPTCSSYAKIQFEYNTIIKAFFYSIFRISRCHPLSDGGFDYPLIKLNISNQKFTKIKVKYWLIPNKDGKYYIIQNWQKNY